MKNILIISFLFISIISLGQTKYTSISVDAWGNEVMTVKDEYGQIKKTYTTKNNAWGEKNVEVRDEYGNITSTFKVVSESQNKPQRVDFGEYQSWGNTLKYCS